MELGRFSSISRTAHNLWMFFIHGCPADMKFFCETRQRQMTAKEMFVRTKNYIFVRPDSLPFDADIKAMGINFTHNHEGGRLYMEFSLVDWALAQQKLQESANQYEKALEIRGRRFFWQGQPVINTSSRHHFGSKTSPRTVLYTTQELRHVPVEPLVYAADLIYGQNCFSERGLPSISVGGRTFSAIRTKPEKQEMLQVQEMRQLQEMLIVQEQVPLMVMTLRMQARLFQRLEVLAMNAQRLEAHVAAEADGNPFLQTE